MDSMMEAMGYERKLSYGWNDGLFKCQAGPSFIYLKHRSMGPELRRFMELRGIDEKTIGEVMMALDRGPGGNE
jgi:hypothetical protein